MLNHLRWLCDFLECKWSVECYVLIHFHAINCIHVRKITRGKFDHAINKEPINYSLALICSERITTTTTETLVPSTPSNTMGVCSASCKYIHFPWVHFRRCHRNCCNQGTKSYALSCVVAYYFWLCVCNFSNRPALLPIKTLNAFSHFTFLSPYRHSSSHAHNSMHI